MILALPGNHLLSTPTTGIKAWSATQLVHLCLICIECCLMLRDVRLFVCCILRTWEMMNSCDLLWTSSGDTRVSWLSSEQLKKGRKNQLRTTIQNIRNTKRTSQFLHMLQISTSNHPQLLPNFPSYSPITIPYVGEFKDVSFFSSFSSELHCRAL